MKSIIPHKLILKNFRSYIEETFTFPTSIGLKLVTGENLVDQIGANGSGKSSLWEAIVFALFGVGIKGSKITSLITWEEKQTSVTFEFYVDSVHHTIYRYGPPMRVTLDGKATTQKEIDQLINLTYDRFLHSVIFGQGEKLFPDLAVPDRATLFDQILDTSVWMKCIETASAKYLAFEKLLTKRKEQLSFLNGKLSSLESEEQLQKQIDQWEEDYRNKEEEVKQQLILIKQKREEWRELVIKEGEEKARQLDQLNEELKEVSETLLDDTTGVADQLDEAKRFLGEYERRNNEEVRKYYGIEIELKNISKSSEFWSTDTCPTCNQKITEDKKIHELQCIEEKKKELTNLKESSHQLLMKLKEQIDLYKNLVTNLTKEQATKQAKKDAYERNYNRITSQIDTVRKEGERLVEQLVEESDPFSVQIKNIQNYKKPTNPYTSRLEQVRKDKIALVSSIITEENGCKNIESLMMAAEYWKSGFKRIRLFFVEQVLLALQIEIKAAISALGLDGWQISLSTETENKSGTTKLGISIKVKSLQAEGTWEGWSGGESQRLRLAIAQGLASLILRSAGCYWSIEVWDEPTNFLSSEGIEDLLEALQYRAESQKKQIFITDHRALQFAGFKEIWGVVKDQSGSKILKVSESEI